MSTPVGNDQAPSVKGRGLALVVDDTELNRLLLQAMLEEQGFSVLCADSGEQALAMFQSHDIDIVFMDIMMPGIDGYETTRRIKALSGDKMVPIIFLTALTDEESLMRCVEAGGDDFLIKPFKMGILQARMWAVERTRDLFRRVYSQREQLHELLDQSQREQAIAESVFSGAVTSHNYQPPGVHFWLKPAATFNGDLFLAAKRPAGGLHVMLGDFTGHGLAAAVGALPVSEVFRSMTLKGFSIRAIVQELNNKLWQLLPADMFMAAVVASFDDESNRLEVINAGMPEAYLLDGASGAIKQAYTSHLFPLGINQDIRDLLKSYPQETATGDRLILYSDGVTEAENQRAEPFGLERLKRNFSVLASGIAVSDAVDEALAGFVGQHKPHDDLSFAEIELDHERLRSTRDEGEEDRRRAAQSMVEGASWSWSIKLCGPALRRDPIPVVMNQIEELNDLYGHREKLFIILSELFNNALEHGVLQLDSCLKHSADGFAEYYYMRERRLAELRDGFIAIAINGSLEKTLGRIAIRVTDSGDGWDAPEPDLVTAEEERGASAFHGRGLPLLRKLCTSLDYLDQGRTAQAVFEFPR